jgi:hypothetical protein
MIVDTADCVSNQDKPGGSHGPLLSDGDLLAARCRVVEIQVQMLVGERMQVHPALLDPADRRSLLRPTRSR